MKADLEEDVVEAVAVEVERAEAIEDEGRGARELARIVSIGVGIAVAMDALGGDGDGADDEVEAMAREMEGREEEGREGF
ncbi:hypothetical protein COCNU_01G022650 [Cocos nucifera]|uniref:Uncharacterized protein n=1 Tax=Cocos nucifera TaxID=13894 RepID=A0A8K0MVS2_COCNU|nr:hypothetical protein COCNU_01G022650 [Cocos nucifera]